MSVLIADMGFDKSFVSAELKVSGDTDSAQINSHELAGNPKEHQETHCEFKKKRLDLMEFKNRSSLSFFIAVTAAVALYSEGNPFNVRCSCSLHNIFFLTIFALQNNVLFSGMYDSTTVSLPSMS